MTNDDLPIIPCPVCEGCDHDLRSGILELMENLVTNLKQAGEKLIDACEAPGAAEQEFGVAVMEFASVRRQISTVIDTIPDIAWVKAVNAQ